MGNAGHREPELLGTRIADRYLLNKPIGQGTCGWVYKATQLALDRPVAVKVLRAKWADDAEIVDRFHAEAVAAAKLSHPNIVAIIDYGCAGGMFYIVMEYLRGRPLGYITRHHSPLPLDRALSLFDHILAGLAAAHAEGIIHADVKTDNVVVVSTLGHETVKLVDFGLAKFVRRHTMQPKRPNRISGTPEYIAPEVVCGRAHTEAADIYSAGVVLYELLTGTTPFAGDTTMEILHRHVNDEPELPSARRPDGAISPALDELVLRALAKHPSQRFLTADSFRGAINRTRGAGHQWEDEDPPHGMTVRRQRIGEAIAHGDANKICSRYLGLAQAFVRIGRHDIAVKELTEAVDVVTGGEGPHSHRGPRLLWRVLLELSRAHLNSGDWYHAFSMAWYAHQQATRRGSADARRRTGELIEKLRPLEPPVFRQHRG